jgi:hypothetical protein
MQAYAASKTAGGTSFHSQLMMFVHTIKLDLDKLDTYLVTMT